MPIGEDALGNSYFQIEIDKHAIAQFKEVSGLSTKINVVEHKELKKGGIPVIKKLPGAQSWGDIKLKRGKTNDKDFWEWIKKVQEGKIDEARCNGSIVLYDYTRGEVARYNLANMWPSEVNIGQLEAGGSAVTVEEMTLVHEGLTLG